AVDDGAAFMTPCTAFADPLSITSHLLPAGGEKVPVGRMRGVAILLLALLFTACRQRAILVGSKNFTESVLLGEIVAQRLEKAGCTVERKLDLGGTLVCDRAIAAGGLDVYPEYSATALTAILPPPHGA